MSCFADETNYSGTWPCNKPIDPEDPEQSYCNKHMSLCVNGTACEHPFCPDHNGMPSLFDPPNYWFPLMSNSQHWEALLAS